MRSFLTLIRDAYRASNWPQPVLVATTDVCTFLEGATIAALVPLLTRLCDEHSTGAHAALRMDAGLAFAGLPTGVVVVTVLISLGASAFLIQSYLAARLQTAYVASWQRRLFETFIPAGACVTSVGLRSANTRSVAVDGFPLAAISAPVRRKRIGCLGRDPFFFNASIADRRLVAQRHSTAARSQQFWRLFQAVAGGRFASAGWNLGEFIVTDRKVPIA